MKIIVFALLFGFFCKGAVNAQVIQPETDEISGSLDFLSETKLKSNLLIQQISATGRAFQVEADQQTGFSNNAIINQTGNNHITSLRQSGYGNEAKLFSTGSFTKMEVNQAGNNNSIVSNFNNNTRQLYSAILEQRGNNNNIKLTLLGNNEIYGVERLVSVTQTGSNLNFTRTYDSSDVPVNIEQKSGMNGQGMDVSVTTSAFYFPQN